MCYETCRLLIMIITIVIIINSTKHNAYTYIYIYIIIEREIYQDCAVRLLRAPGRITAGEDADHVD